MVIILYYWHQRLMHIQWRLSLQYIQGFRRYFAKRQTNKHMHRHAIKSHNTSKTGLLGRLFLSTEGGEGRTGAEMGVICSLGGPGSSAGGPGSFWGNITASSLETVAGCSLTDRTKVSGSVFVCTGWFLWRRRRKLLRGGSGQLLCRLFLLVSFPLQLFFFLLGSHFFPW